MACNDEALEVKLYASTFKGSFMRLLFSALIFISSVCSADTIENYMKIANNIPVMEMKADNEAQAWARSARHVLNITCESIAETLTQANDAASQQGKPLFCLTNGAQLNPLVMNELIQSTYKSISSQQSDKDKMTVSQIALLGITKTYPCQNNQGIAQIKSMMGQ
jgi:hypothetical protein